MTPPKYPLCEALGVQLRTMSGEFLNVPEAKGLTEVVLAADLERIIKAAPVVYGAERVRGEMNREWLAPLTERNPPIGSTHTARLLCVQPIVRDTAESLLREIIADHEALLRVCPDRAEWPLVTRARKLLGGKGAG